jgi:hypothetical protein
VVSEEMSQNVKFTTNLGRRWTFHSGELKTIVFFSNQHLFIVLMFEIEALSVVKKKTVANEIVII